MTDLIDHLFRRNIDCILSADGCFEVVVAPDNLIGQLLFLKKDSACRFEVLIDVFAVDYPMRSMRFEVIYTLLSIVKNLRMRLKVQVDLGQAVPSVVDLFSSAGWFEREVFDMYGIVFSGHPDLRRILTDYEFKGNPMLKNFPLTGYEEVAYDPEQGKVVYNSINLQQDYRSFEFLSPWEGVNEGEKKK